MSDPLVSIITPTIPSRRRWLVERCMPSVRGQSYPHIEHIIVQDGPGERGSEGKEALCDAGSTRFVELGRNWRQFLKGASVGATARVAGTLLARGEYLGYLDDDDEVLPYPVEHLLNLLRSSGKDFVVSQFRRFFYRDGVKEREDVVGDATLEFGRFGTPLLLHKVECLETANWDWRAGYGEDAALVNAWAKGGRTHAFLEEITVHVHKEI